MNRNNKKIDREDKIMESDKSKIVKDDFESLYITLEKILHRITGIPSNIPVFPYFKKILPDAYYVKMETICDYRNACYGHGVKMEGERPVAPKGYINFLKKEIHWVQNNEEHVKAKILSLVSKKKVEQEKQVEEKIETCVDCELALKRCIRDHGYYKKTIDRIGAFLPYTSRTFELLYKLASIIDCETEEDIAQSCKISKEDLFRYFVEKNESLYHEIYLKKKSSISRIFSRTKYNWVFDYYCCEIEEVDIRQQRFFIKYIDIVEKYIPEYKENYVRKG